VPLTTNPGLIGHGLALAEGALSPALTVGADSFGSRFCQVGNPGLPLMVPAASMDAAWAAQPDLLCTFMGEVGRQLAQVEGGVPKVLDDHVI